MIRLLKQYLLVGFAIFNIGVMQAQEILLSNDYLSSKIDSIVETNMEQYNIPGVVYAIVKNDDIIHIGSQEFSNLEEGTLVNQKTTFMLGSLAKLFTTLAVLQLYEQGEVDLDTDINNYIGAFQIPYNLTLRQILTHTTGLEESVFERVKISEDDFLPLSDYLETHLPDQVIEAGKYPAYSNHGMALAGLVIQEISGVLFEDYIRTNILLPLDMLNSSFRLNARSKEDLATPYQLKNDKLSATNLEYVQTTPSAMLISSGEDIAKFMLFNLRPENYNLIKPETLKLMHMNQYQPHPNVWGRAFGYFERMYRGKRLLEHGGSRKGFYCKMALIPEDDLSIFIAFNGGKSRFREKVIYSFLSTIYEKIEINKIFDLEPIEIEEYEGTYLSNRRSESDFSKLILQSTFVEKIKIERQTASSFRMLGSDYKMISKDQFDVSDDSTSTFPIAFGRNENGAIETLFLPGRSDSYQKMARYQHENIGLGAIIIAFIIFLVSTIIRIVNLKNCNLIFGLSTSIQTFDANKFLYSSINLFFITSLVIVLLLKGEALQYEIPSILYLVFSFALFGLIVLVFITIQYLIVWNKSNYRERLSNGLFLVTSMIFTWQLYYWNLIGFNF